MSKIPTMKEFFALPGNGLEEASLDIDKYARKYGGNAGAWGQPKDRPGGPEQKKKYDLERLKKVLGPSFDDLEKALDDLRAWERENRGQWHVSKTPGLEDFVSFDVTTDEPVSVHARDKDGTVHTFSKDPESSHGWYVGE